MPGDWDDCKQLVVEHFPNMHTMAMEKFFIPVEICNQVANDQVKVHLLSFQDFLD